MSRTYALIDFKIAYRMRETKTEEEERAASIDSAWEEITGRGEEQLNQEGTTSWGNWEN